MSKGFKGGMRGGMGGNMQQLLQQAQKMQRDMEKMQEELAQKTAEAAVGGGAVTAVVNGKHDLVSLKIAPEAADLSDVEILQDMIVAAVNEANKKITEQSESEMGKITGGMKLPGMF